MLIVNGSSGQELKVIGDHMHSAAKVYPSLASVVTITSPAAATNAYGAGVDVIATNVVTAPFDIHWVNVEEMEMGLTLGGRVEAGSSSNGSSQSE